MLVRCLETDIVNRSACVVRWQLAQADPAAALW